MIEFEVVESEKFRRDFEEALVWLYTHNLEQSERFADKKFLELNLEVSTLVKRLKVAPRMGQRNEMTGVRRLPLYEGRFTATWYVFDKIRLVLLQEFLDSKYPR